MCRCKIILLALCLFSINLLSFAQENSGKWETEVAAGIGDDYYGMSAGEYYSPLPYLKLGAGIGTGIFTRKQHGSYYQKGHNLWDINCFGDVRLTPLKSILGPEVGLRAGVLADLNCPAPGWFFDPYLGIRYGRFSFRVLYKMTRVYVKTPYWNDIPAGKEGYELLKDPSKLGEPDGHIRGLEGDNILSFSIAVRF